MKTTYKAKSINRSIILRRLNMLRLLILENAQSGDFSKMELLISEYETLIAIKDELNL
ncbi:hypothetical protein AB7D55_001310 [Vibrio mimicus]